MKQKTNQYLKYGLIFIGIGLLYLGCQKDQLNHLENQSSDKSFLKIEFVNDKQIKENRGLFKKLSSFNGPKAKSNSLNKEVYISEGDFTVETDYAKYMESPDGEFKSYTFAVLPIDKEQTTLQNLVLYSYNNSDYYSVLATYYLDHYQLEELKEKDHVNSSYPIEFATLDGDYSSLLAREEPCDFDVTVYHITPDTGEAFEWGNNSVCEHINTETGETDCEVHVIITLNCISPGGSGGGGGNLPDYGSYEWTWGYETGGSTGGNNNGSYDYYIPVASSPTINKKDKKRVEKLMEIVSNPIIEAKIQELKPKIFFEESGNEEEDGARFDLVGENQYEVREPNFTNGYSIRYDPTYQNNEMVSLHIHQQLFDLILNNGTILENVENSPIYSAEDIVEFLDNVKYLEDEVNNTLTNDVTSLLMSEEGVFALVVNDENTVLNAQDVLLYQSGFDEFKDKFKEKVNENSAEDQCDNQCYIDKLVTFIKNYQFDDSTGLGIDIYQAIINDENYEIFGWIKL